jgi:hypothetical protein
MRILACRNFRISYPLAHFETFSAALAPGFPFGAPSQLLRRSLAQVRGLVAADRDVRVIGVGRTAVPLRATAPVGHLIADRMGLQRVEIFSPVRPHAIRLSPEGAG